MQQDAEGTLSTVLSMTTDWLKYAEAKNAGLGTVNGAAVAAIVGYLGSASSFPEAWKLGLWVAATCFSISTLLVLVSFIPKIDPANVLANRYGRRDAGDNLYFFGHLSKYKPQELVDAVCAKYSVRSMSPPRCLDLANQITANARITTVKSQWFKRGAWVTFVGFVALYMVPFFLWLLGHLSSRVS